MAEDTGQSLAKHAVLLGSQQVFSEALCPHELLGQSYREGRWPKPSVSRDSTRPSTAADSVAPKPSFPTRPCGPKDQGQAVVYIFIHIMTRT